MDQRLELIEQWVKYIQPDKKIISQLQKFGWDYDGEPYDVTAGQVCDILNRYLKNELLNKDVYQWADFIEMREDINYEKFKDIIFCLANPEINEELSPELAHKFISILKL